MKKYQNLINQVNDLVATKKQNDNWNKNEAICYYWVIDALKEDNLAYARYLAARSDYHEEYLKILGINRQFTDEQKQTIALFVSDLWDTSWFARRQVNKDDTINFLKTYGIKEIQA